MRTRRFPRASWARLSFVGIALLIAVSAGLGLAASAQAVVSPVKVRAGWTALPGTGVGYVAAGDRYFVYKAFSVRAPLTVVDTLRRTARVVELPDRCEAGNSVILAASDRLLVDCPRGDGKYFVGLFDFSTETVIEGKLSGPGAPVAPGDGTYCPPFEAFTKLSTLLEIDGYALLAGRRGHVLLGRCGSSRAPLDMSMRSAVSDQSVLAGWTTWFGGKGQRRCDVSAYDIASSKRFAWNTSPFGKNRCVDLLQHTRYAVIAGHIVRPAQGPNFVATFRFAIAKRPR